MRGNCQEERKIQEEGERGSGIARKRGRKEDWTAPESIWKEVTKLSYLGPTIIVNPSLCMYIFWEEDLSQAKDHR